MHRKTENGSLGNFGPVKIPSYSGSYLDQNGLTHSGFIFKSMEEMRFPR